MLKVLFAGNIFVFLLQLFAYIEKRLDNKSKASLKIYDAKDCSENYGNTHTS